jgi:hypothetical protein
MGTKKPKKPPFMSVEENRSRVLERLTNISDDARSALVRDYREFKSHRREYMSSVQITEMDRVINRLRSSLRRANLTPEQREAQKVYDRVRICLRREFMTPEQKALENERNRERASLRRESMTPEQRAAQNEFEKERKSLKRKRMTPEQRTVYNKRGRERIARRRANMTPEEKAAQSKFERMRRKIKRANMTTEERAEQNKLNKELKAHKKENMTQEQIAKCTMDRRRRFALRRAGEKECLASDGFNARQKISELQQSSDEAALPSSSELIDLKSRDIVNMKKSIARARLRISKHWSQQLKEDHVPMSRIKVRYRWELYLVQLHIKFVPSINSFW